MIIPKIMDRIPPIRPVTPIPSIGMSKPPICFYIDYSKVYVMGDIHTNTVDGFWSLVKRGISGVNHAVSEKYLPNYLNEYVFRYNRREDESPMFESFLSQLLVSR